MGEHRNLRGTSGDDPEQHAFVRALLRDLRALETMLERGMLESGVRRIGAEQEIFLVHPTGRPAPLATEVLDQLRDPRFTTELARFNLEANLTPVMFGGACLRQLETATVDAIGRARRAAAAAGADVALFGILPTLELDDLGMESMTPAERYTMLNDAMVKLRGGSFEFRIRGIDELDIKHDNVMLESCNTSFQAHFQVGHEEFARLYNLAQAITGPVLAAAVNSPVLLGQRLWEETRVALFQQSVDTRSTAHQARGLRPRVTFGDRWVRESAVEIFREDIARFRVVLATGTDEDPAAAVDRGEPPQLTALRLHNGTVYRWNRPCYGIVDGVAHLRIENRVLPAGPTVRDEIANAALLFGLMVAVGEEHGPIERVMAFDHAKENFVSAARRGLRAQLTWVKGAEYGARDLLLSHLIPLAREGLAHSKIDAADIDLYLGVIEDRVRSGQTGAQWTQASLAAMSGQGTRDQQMRALVCGTVQRQRIGSPVHTWAPATLAEIGDWRSSFLRVGQYMATDLFTVRPGDLVDLVASLMEWEHIRHVPVEDDEGRLVGLVSHRSLLRLVGRGLAAGGHESVAVRDIMKSSPITVTPDTSTLAAIEAMREHKVGCLPVVKGERLVGIVTEHDLIEVAGRLLEDHLREASDR